MLPVRLALFLVVAITWSCAPGRETAVDSGTVTSNRTSMRQKNSSTSRTVTLLNAGDKVDILERQSNWYRVRSGDLEGWMEESTVVSNVTLERIQGLAAASRNDKAQNGATLVQDANLRIEPGRTTAVIRKLPARTHVEVLTRQTLPRPGSTNGEAWMKVRVAPTESGWLLGNLLEFDLPADIAQYSEERIYTAVQPLNQVEDPAAGTVTWYLVGERPATFDPALDFDGIRVFTWNMARHRYETAFRLKGLRGVYPLDVERTGGKTVFRVHELAKGSTAPVIREFNMTGVVVRETKKKP